MVRPFLCLILLSGLATVVASYIIQPSQLQSCDDRPNAECDGMDISDLTLSQLLNNLSYYLTNNTALIFLPGNYSLESELLVENVHSFSMYAWPGSSSKAVITCGHNARFEFRNIESTVTVSGLEFVGCFENQVRDVNHFLLENSEFFGNGQEIFSCTAVLGIEESMASLDRVILSAVYEIVSTAGKVTGIALRSSNVTITQSRFEGNNVGLNGAVISNELGSDIVIINSTFIKNSASLHYASGIVHTSSHGTSVKIYDSKFVQNEGVILCGENFNILIAHIRFMNNKCSIGCVVIATDSNLTVSHSTFSDNTGLMLKASRTEVSISYSEFLCNNGYYTSSDFDGVITGIDHSKFVNNTGLILTANNTEVSISYSEFLSNYRIQTSLLKIVDGVIITIDHSKFVNNTGLILTANNTEVSISYSEFLCNNGHYTLSIIAGMVTTIDHSKFINNTGSILTATSTEVSISYSEFLSNYRIQNSLLKIVDGVIITIDHSKFVNNTGYSVLRVVNTGISLHLNEFINNYIPTGRAVVYIWYYTTAENLTGNVFTNNSATYDILISSRCRSDLGISLGSSPCTPCSSDDWYLDLIGIVVAAFIAGIALVISMLALNLTVAVGTLNGILFYANIVAANSETYFFAIHGSKFCHCIHFLA
jgi:hypothetical protein